MLLVETFLNTSPGKGVGLFAKFDIPKNTKYWVRNERFDKVISVTELKDYPLIASDYITKYGFLEKSNNWYLCGDNARFSNHSSSPNTLHLFNQEGLLQYCIALCDIHTGDEITCNYVEICLTCKNGVDFDIIL